jgi:phosphoglucosamine mutase
MARRLFGTDGVRGVAGEVLTGDLALALGRAAVEQLGADHPRVLVIRDTRESGEMLEAALAAGVASAGGDVFLAGVLPTPAAPLLIAAHGYDLAAVISASHNPYRDNGIKFFGADGYKLGDATEEAIEERLEAPSSRAPRIGRVERVRGSDSEYLAALAERFGTLDLSAVRVLLDCANGATHQVAPAIFRRLRAQLTVLHAEPDGRNINDGCGSTHVEGLAAAMREGGHDIGFAFDGDGDRVLAIDRHGVVVDGDELVALAALHLRAAGRLPGDGVAVTVMTNYGFHTAMRDAGIEVATTAVGDRYVLEELRRRAWALGGEQSGHIIDLGFNRSGDGIAAALLTLEALAGRDLADRAAMRRLPQRLVNVPVADRDAAMASEALAEAVARESAALAGRGRVLVRPSGTEQLVRVMVEAPADAEAEETCARLVQIVQNPQAP